MGKKADRLAYQLELWKDLVLSVGKMVGIDVDVAVAVDDDQEVMYTALVEMESSFKRAIDKKVSVSAEVVSDHIALAKQVQAMQAELATGVAYRSRTVPQGGTDDKTENDMGMKADLTVQVGLWQGLVQSVGALLGIVVDVDRAMDGPYMAHLFTRFSSAVDSMRKLASAAADENSPQVAGSMPDDRGTYRNVAQERPADGGTRTAIVRAEQEQPHDDGDLHSSGEADLEMLRDENGNLRASLQEKMDALSQAHMVLNRITAAAGIDRWTPDGQQVVDKINQTGHRGKSPAPGYLISQVRKSLSHIRAMRASDVDAAELDVAIKLLADGLDKSNQADLAIAAVKDNLGLALRRLASFALPTADGRSNKDSDIEASIRHALSALEGL